MGVPLGIWTIGHSNHSFARLGELLRGEAIDVVVDVRSYPYSRIAPQFNREELEAALARIGVDYRFLGEELGGRPAHEEDYDEQGHARYDRMAEQPAFRAAVRQLVSERQERRVALMCSEGSPQECHRRLLVGKVLTEHGVQLHHILPTGVVEREGSVSLAPEDAQESLFDEETAWRSTRSVSRRRRLSASSAA
ncbi:MAG TPA: DUF488 domain-containing protein [Solirubrobacteraceae bacterium]|nr:DUF488 domain-containing protein [Solirubrobacteraceae bacterium]